MKKRSDKRLTTNMSSPTLNRYFLIEKNDKLETQFE